MKQLTLLIFLFFSGVCLSRAAGPDFNSDVLPILSNNCFQCHGPDAKARKAELRLDLREGATRDLGGYRAVSPGKPEESEIISRILSDDPEEIMPPPKVKKQLTASEKEILRQWVASGAEYREHWAFVAPAQAEIPVSPAGRVVKNPIDRFVLARLKNHNLKPSSEATRSTLIRRVSFSLTGLPPTLEESDRFLADNAPGAYDRMVNRYLDSPAYGEHMARHWLDLARYADSNGYQYDTERQQWVWRDWVIDAYNRNKPFDEFTIEQLAGDLLPQASEQQRLATGFNRNHGITIEGGIIDEEYRTEYVMDRVVTTSQVWLAMTMGCARCHDHKYDAISQKEFYQVFHFFNQVPERGANGFAPKQRLASPLAATRKQELENELKRLKEELNKPKNLDVLLEKWTSQIAGQPGGGWQILSPKTMDSTGGSTLRKLDDNSILAGGTNPPKDIYEITAGTASGKLTAVRLEALTHETLPGGGPGRHSNSNFVLSEFELTAASARDPSLRKVVKFVQAKADYSQAKYEVSKAIDGTVDNLNGWAVDGPTRKKPATAIFIAKTPFGYEGGTLLLFRLRHEGNFGAHGVGRPRLSVTDDPAGSLQLQGIPANIRLIAARKPRDRTSQQAGQLKEYFLTHHNPDRIIKERIATLEKQQTASFPETMIMQDMARPRATHILHRGQYNEPGEKVSAGVPAIFPAMRKNHNTRLGFAQWLMDPTHPLTARVAVNRYWQQLFGTGLVKTAEDFGIQGELPSHPALLDWLALEFIRSGWDTKHMYRLILNSATYRQTANVGKAAYRSDPENRLLARGPRMRLDAEEIRDSLLASSGLLVRQLGGKSVYPYQPKGLWMELNNRPGYSKAYPQGKGDDLYRRSLYTFWKRTVPSPMLKTFDAPEREFCTTRRSKTNTPLQALVMLNGTQFVEAARHLAQRMLIEGGGTLNERITYGFRLVNARVPGQPELALLRDAYTENLQHYQSNGQAALQLLQVGDSPFNNALNQAKLAAMTSVARLLFNLNESITKG
ncbi:MAG: PSD1 and planctomycete cytochrome C domain-containing protein [Verrucomicrobiota bacterium]|nr:PSD1 and planctomycete cytochrome C domain-containing protein [Verrucomicrobiota bacterium]